MQSDNILLKAALDYTAAGFSVFPLIPKDKRPLTKNGFHDASNDPKKIKEWWGKWPNANIGLPTGKSNGFFVIDVDGELPEEFPVFSAGVTVKTGKGCHYYVEYPEADEIRNQSRTNGLMIDVRGDGGYVVAPPSIHPDGGQYEFYS